MSKYHERRNRPKRVSEPVQVYLATPELARLERLTTLLDTTKSDVLRRALEALERQVTEPGAHPALQLIGLVGSETPRTKPGIKDVAREHDQALADSEVESWRDTSGDG